MKNQRLQNLQTALSEKKLASFLVSSPANRFYLTDWEADSESGFLLITSKKSYIITDSRYTEHAQQFSDQFEIVDANSGLEIALVRLVEKEKINSLGFEEADLSVFSFNRLKKALKGLRLVPLAKLTEEIRSVKEPAEIEKLKKAASVGDQAFKHILKFLKPGRKEKEVAWEMTTFMRSLGAQSNAWEPLIVAAGANSSMPHYGAGEAKIRKGDNVLLDFGAKVDGYVSDMTRVVFIGKPTTEQKRIYEAVLEGQKLGIKMVKPGIKTSKIDEKVRGLLEKSSKFVYQHGLGHGVGIEVHESPSLSPTSKQKLEVGNVVTIEPGIYVPGWGGVRIEDVVLVTENGHEVLTKSPKDIKSVTV